MNDPQQPGPQWPLVQPGQQPPPGYQSQPPGYGPPPGAGWNAAGQPQQPGPPPGYGPPPGWNAAGYGPPPRRKHTGRNAAMVFTTVMAVIIVAGVAGSGSGGSGGTPAASSPGPAAAAPAAAPNPHAVVKDGDFAFRFKGMLCGAKAARAVYNDPAFTGRKPPGSKECIVELRVTDDKGEAQTFFDSNQFATDSNGHQLDADDNGIYLTGDKDDTQLNPGVSLKVLIPYNLPAGDSITGMVLHDSEFSGGVTVRF